MLSQKKKIMGQISVKSEQIGLKQLELANCQTFLKL